MRSFIRNMTLVLSMICIIAFASPLTLFATSLDDLSRGSQGGSTTSSQETGDDGAVSDYLKGYTPINKDNMDKAGSMASPIVSAIGTLSGFIIMIVSAGIFLVTALDLCYIGLPFTRSFLNPSQGAGAQGGGAPMGGMGMGMRGGMSMGGAGGTQPESGLRRRWVSDEAVACVSLSDMQSQPAGGGMPMGGMGMPMGGMGMQGGGAQQPTSTKSVILEYLKKRSFFIIVFAIATVILTSALLTDCGLNLAELLSKIISKFNGQIQNVNI